jgi:hypothetical protein
MGFIFFILFSKAVRLLQQTLDAAPPGRERARVQMLLADLLLQQQRTGDCIETAIRHHEAALQL